MKRIIATMKGEFATLDTSDVQLRKFGLLVGGVILFFVGLFGIFSEKELHGVLPTIGLLLVGLGFVAPQLLKWAYYCWMGIAIVFGYFIGNALLFLLFYIFVTPIALLKKIFGAKKKASGESYWIPRDKPWSKESVERLF